VKEGDEAMSEWREAMPRECSCRAEASQVVVVALSAPPQLVAVVPRKWLQLLSRRHRI